MLTNLILLLPMFAWFGLGLLIKKSGIAEKAHGDFLLRFVFFVTLPFLILSTVPQLDFSAEKSFLPFINIAVNLACMFVSLLLIKLKGLDQKISGTVLVNTMIINNSFMFPFILAVYGEAGFADAILFDFGNAIMMATYVYALAFKYGGENFNRWAMFAKIMKSPLVWSLLLSVGLAITQLQLPDFILAIINPVAQMTGPLILIALGIHFSLQMVHLKLAGLIVFIRMGAGLLFGVLIATALGLQGLTFIVVSLCSAAPIGFNALTICSMAKLDEELSASAVSISILAGMIYIPILILIFGS